VDGGDVKLKMVLFGGWLAPAAVARAAAAAGTAQVWPLATSCASYCLTGAAKRHALRQWCLLLPLYHMNRNCSGMLQQTQLAPPGNMHDKQVNS
jgi:hypothetical protein